MIVGLSGKKRSGKDTFAQVLVDEFGFTRVAFADALKETVLRLNPIVDAFNTGAWVATTRLADVVGGEGWEKAKERPEVRRLLQEHGLAIREVMPSFWIDAAMKKADEFERVVLTDVRFPNEADAVGEGLLIRIDRPALMTFDEHLSETALDDYGNFDEYVLNSGTVEDLHEKARAIMRSYL